MCVVFLTHLVCRFLCRFQMIVGYLWLTSMLIDVRIDTEPTPSVSCNEEIPEPGLPFQLIFNPDFEIFPLYFWFLFHNVYEWIRTTIVCYFSLPPTNVVLTEYRFSPVANPICFTYTFFAVLSRIERKPSSTGGILRVSFSFNVPALFH